MQRCLFLLAIPRGDMEVSYFNFDYLQRVYCSCCKRTQCATQQGRIQDFWKGGHMYKGVCGGGGGGEGGSLF